MCARSGQKKYNKLCPWKKDTEIRRERKNDFRGLDVGEGVYEGKMKNRRTEKLMLTENLKLPTKSRAALKSGTVINYSRKSRNTARSRGQKR